MLETILGWETQPHYPDKKRIIVFSHTSYWDVIVWLILFKKSSTNSFVLFDSRYYTWATKWLYDLLHCIPSTRLENRDGGLIGKLVERFRHKNESICLSPKGTVKKKAWRTGYYHLARKLSVKIYPLIIDYEERKIWFGEPCDPNNNTEPWCQEFLVNQFKTGVDFNVENLEYLHPYNAVLQNPYERLFPFDFCLVSLLLFLPQIFILLIHNYYLLGGMSCVAFTNAFVYHYYHEGNKKNIKWIRLLEVGSVYSTFFLILLKAIPYYKTLSYSCYSTLLLGYFFLRCGYKRDSTKKRGKYHIYHSIFHILGALGTLQLTESFVYGN